MGHALLLLLLDGFLFELVQLYLLFEFLSVVCAEIISSDLSEVSKKILLFR